jgi:hypothetical protein
MNEQLFDFFIYTVAACHVISLVYLFYANYVRVRHTQLGKTAATAASVVAVPWLIYAVFFVARQIACGDTGAPFYASLSCVLDVLWILYLGLGVFSVAFVWATWLCWTLFRALHRKPIAPLVH